MTLVDANLLIYAYTPGAQQHAAASAWLTGLLSGREMVALSWQGLLAFLRITTNSQIYSSPATLDQALEKMAALLGHPRVTVLEATPLHWTILTKTLLQGQARGPLVSDAELAALAIEHGAVLATTDRDFARFPGLRFFNPLAATA